MRRRRDTPRTNGGARREPTAEALERRYRRLLAWYPAAYRAARISRTADAEWLAGLKVCRRHVLTIKEDVAVPRWSCRCPRESRAAFPWLHRDRDGRVLWSRARRGDA